MILHNNVLAIAAVKEERWRQEHLKHQGRFTYTAADLGCSDMIRLAMLTEEIGEVARAMQNNDENNLYDELTQVAAISIAWLEYLIELKEKEITNE